MNMETTAEFSAELGLHRLWGRRLTGSNVHDEDITDLLEDRDVFPPAQVEIDEDAKSRPSSPCLPCQDPFYLDLVQNTFAPICKPECKCTTEIKPIELNGASIGDIPARYRISNIRKHEFPAVGIFVDPRIVPGFKYRVRTIQQNGHQEKWLFKHRALELESIGRGYSRRITFKADRGDLNNNPHYFWADSRPEGFAFELELISPGDKFTVFDASRLPVGTLEITRNQVPQEEVGHRILEDGSIEKTVRLRSLCKVEWYEDNNCDLIVPMSGVAISIKSKGCIKTNVIGVTIGSYPRRGFTLKAGINNRLRSTKVRGESIADVPTIYTITGLDAHELPVIGTYVDPRIVPGFYYRVRPAAGKRRPLFNGRILKLTSIGMGYGKRITFDPDSLNQPENYFWSDSHPDGLGFEPSAVRAGMKFEILAGNLRLGEATVFRADAPQIEKKQEKLKNNGKQISLIKHIHVDVTCHVTIDTRFDKSPEPLIMRISGTALVLKTNRTSEAQLIRLENIGLDSQLNILFSTQWEELVFIPI